MPDWLWIFVILAGGLFVGKMIYAVSTAAVLPYTQGALYVTTSAERIATFMDAVDLSPDDVLIDLGCGDGRVIKAVSERHGVKAIGYEVNLLAYFLARIRCMGLNRIEVRLGDFWKADLSVSSVVFCYLYPDVMPRLAEKLSSELRPETLVVSCNFRVPGWKVEQVLHPRGSLHNAPIFLYRIP